MAATDDWDPVETIHNALDPRLAVTFHDTVTFSGSAKDFIRFTLASDVFSFPQGSAVAARKVPFSAGSSPSPDASRVPTPSAASEVAPTNG